MPTYSLNVNGADMTVTVPSPDMPLLWVLRDIIGLTGTKYGCGIEVCGACMVMVNGQPEKSCQFAVGEARGRKVLTVEGLAQDLQGARAQAAWVDHQVPQCGFCQPGMLMATTAAMKAGHSGREIAAEISNICMCGTYRRINEAVQGL